MKLTEWLEDKLEIFFALLTLVAGAVWVYLDGFTGETIAEVTATLGTAAVILVTFVNRMKRQEVTNFVDAGSKALSKLQKEYPKILSGPKYSKRKKDSPIEETTANERKYLFFQKDVKGLQAQFIPVMPFEQAVVAVFLGSWTLKISTGRLGTPDEIVEAKAVVKNAIITMADSKFSGLYQEIPFDPNKKVNENLCVALEFDGNISVRKFEAAVYKIGKTALGAISSEKKSENNV